MDLSHIQESFQDPVCGAELSFKKILTAFSYPLTMQSFDDAIQAIQSVPSAALNAIITLVDFEVSLYISDTLASKDLRDFIVFYTKASLTDSPEKANFLLLSAKDTSQLFEQAYKGDIEHPETAATIILVTDSLTQGSAITLTGPGIQHEVLTAPITPNGFWDFWRNNQPRFPLGIDILWVCGQTIMAMPRSISIKEEGQ